MSNLVEVLRDADENPAAVTSWRDLVMSAADRIEYLEQNRDYWREEALRAQQHRDGANAQIEILERELAEARKQERERIAKAIDQCEDHERAAYYAALIRGMKDE